MPAKFPWLMIGFLETLLREINLKNRSCVVIPCPATEPHALDGYDFDSARKPKTLSAWAGMSDTRLWWYLCLVSQTWRLVGPGHTRDGSAA